MRKSRKRISKAYRTFLFKKRMIEIISLMLNADGTHCFFCGHKFTIKDFPLQGKDKVEIHHVTYVPEVKVLAHKKCHRDYHAEQKKSKS